MTVQPNWTLEEVVTGLNDFLNLEPVKGLMIAVIVLGLVGMIMSTLAGFFGAHE